MDYVSVGENMHVRFGWYLMLRRQTFKLPFWLMLHFMRYQINFEKILILFVIELILRKSLTITSSDTSSRLLDLANFAALVTSFRKKKLCEMWYFDQKNEVFGRFNRHVFFNICWHNFRIDTLVLIFLKLFFYLESFNF